MKTSYYIYFILLLSPFLVFSEVEYNNGASTIVVESNNDIYNLWDVDWNLKKGEPIFDKSQDLSDNDWFSAPINGAWQMSVPELVNYNDNGWFNLSIDLKQTENLGLLLPVGLGNYQFYINNKLLYQNNSFFGSKPLFLKIPSSSVKLGLNYLHVSIQPFSGWGGFTGFMNIGPFEKLNNIWIIYVIKNCAVTFISIFLSVFFLIMYYFRQKEKYNLIFSMLSFSVGIFTFGFTGLSYYLFNYSWAYWLLTFLGGIGMYLFPILFIHSFFNHKLKIIGKTFTWFYSFLALFVFVEYLFTGQIFYFNKYLYMAFNMSYILVVIYLIVISIKNVINNLKYSKTMLLATMLLTITFVYSMLGFMNIIIAAPLIGEGFFLMTLVFSVILAKRNAKTHSDLEYAHAELEFTNLENLELNKTLEEKVKDRTLALSDKNDEITQSIDYSALIQNSILPSTKDLNEVLEESYIIWKPKDIVGGDLYWFLKDGEDFLIAIIDCTGHGVPGALLTMTANSVLDRIVSHVNATDPGIILTEMNKIFKELFNNDNPYDIKDDGLDIGLCYYNSKLKNLTFAGSKIRLFINDNGEVSEIKGDKQGIGYKRSKGNYTYTNNTINVTNNLTFHMTTDGYVDQSGGNNGFGFGWTNYKKILTNYSNVSLGEHKKILEDKLLEYQGEEYSQRDDITLIGFKIKQS